METNGNGCAGIDRQRRDQRKDVAVVVFAHTGLFFGREFLITDHADAVRSERGEQRLGVETLTALEVAHVRIALDDLLMRGAAVNR